MRLLTLWKSYLQSCIFNKAFDKHHEQILRSRKSIKLTEECINRLKLNASLCCITVAPIRKEIPLFHNFTEIGGSIVSPSKNWITLKGLVPSALEIQFDLIFFETSEGMTFPIWKNIKKVSFQSDVNSTSPGSSKHKV